MATTTNFGWTTPDNTGYVKDGALAIRTLGNSIDTSLVDLKGGTTDQVLKKASGTDMDFSWVTPVFTSVAAFSDQKAANTQGGTFTSGAWRTRDLNTTVGTNGISGASIASNQLTLPAGTYLIQGSAPAYDVNQHMTRFYNITDSTVAINGGSAYTDASDIMVTHSPFSGVVVITGTKVFEIQHYAGATSSTYGFGIQANNGSVETYTQITVLKVA